MATLTDLSNHFSNVAATLTRDTTYIYGVKSELNSNRNWPFLEFIPGSPDSLLSGTEINQGQAYEVHNVMLRISDLYQQSEQETVSLSQKYDQLQELMMEFLYKAFSREYLQYFSLVKGINNIQVFKAQRAAAAEPCAVVVKFQVRMYTGCSEYTDFESPVGCPPGMALNTDNEVIVSIPAGGSGIIPDVSILNTSGGIIDSVHPGGSWTQLTLTERITEATDEEVVTAIDAAGKDNSILPGVLRLNTDTQIRSAMVFNETLASFIQALQDADLNSLTPEQITYLIGTFDSAEIAQLSQAQVRELTNTQLALLSTAQLNYIATILTSTQVQLLSSAQVQTLSSTQIGYLVAAQIQALTNGQLDNLSNTQKIYLLPESMAAASADQVVSAWNGLADSTKKLDIKLGTGSGGIGNCFFLEFISIETQTGSPQLMTAATTPFPTQVHLYRKYIGTGSGNFATYNVDLSSVAYYLNGITLLIGDDFTIPANSSLQVRYKRTSVASNSNLTLQGNGRYGDLSVVIGLVEPETTAWVQAVPNTPSTTLQTQLNTLIKAWKTANVWDKIIAFYPFCVETSGQAAYNIKDPRNLDAAYRASVGSGMFYTPNRYYQGNGSTGFINTHFDPVAAADSRFTTVAHSIGFWIIGNVTEGQSPGAFGPNQMGNQNVNLGIRPLSADDRIEYKSSNTTRKNTTIASLPDGLYALGRTDAATIKLGVNGTLTTIANAAEALNAGELYTSAYNNSGTAAAFSVKKLACAFIGSPDLVNATNYAAFYSALNTFITARQSI